MCGRAPVKQMLSLIKNRLAITTEITSSGSDNGLVVNGAVPEQISVLY